MGFILLIVVGSILGWLASIITRSEDQAAILRDVAVGVAGALVVGILANSGSILVGLRAEALLLSLLGSIASLVIFNLVYRRLAH